MEYVNLGRTGVKVSKLCLGCMNFGARAQEADATAILERALAAGINFIDTANVYGHAMDDPMQGRGRSEEIVGRALRRSGRRAEVVLATKAYFAMSGDPNSGGSSRRHLIEACEASLRRLQVDYIDLYQLHHPSNEIPIDETLRALDDLICAGKVRYLGTSSFAAWQIVEALWVSKEYGLNRFVCEQPAYNLLDRRAERELLPMAQTYGLAVIPWSPTAGGFLSGRYRPDAPAPGGSRFAEFWKGEEKRHGSAPAFAILEVLEALGAEKGYSSYQLALAWCARQPGITSPIIGPRTLEQLEESLRALDVQLAPADFERLDAVARPRRATVPYYGFDGADDGLAWVPWGPHQHRW